MNIRLAFAAFFIIGFAVAAAAWPMPQTENARLAPLPTFPLSSPQAGG